MHTESSGLARTLQSAYALHAGLFPVGSVPSREPGVYVPVPVYSRPTGWDLFVRGMMCAFLCFFVGRGGEVEQRDGSNVVELAFVLGSAWNLNPNEYVPVLFGYSVPCTYTCTYIISTMISRSYILQMPAPCLTESNTEAPYNNTGPL